MNKVKLFTPEDFDKSEDKSFGRKYKYWVLSISALFIFVSIVLYCVFCGKCEEKKEADAQVHTELITIDAEAQENEQGSEAINLDPVPRVKEFEQVEEQSTKTPITDTPKEELTLEATTIKPSLQPANVSDNVEQEALNVIRGIYGNVPERREKLGSKYQDIQNRVNALKREGAF